MRVLLQRFCLTFASLFFIVPVSSASAQDLDPRAYAHVPVDMTLLVAGFSYSHGGVVTDPMVPLEDLQATVETPVLGVGRTFALFGRTAQAFVALPYSWAKASALVLGEPMSVTRSGLGDMRIRFSLLFSGAPAMTLEELPRAPRGTILGASVMLVVPTGQFFPEKLINIGAHRWAFKPEIALSHPLDDRWLLDIYAGVWFFTTNDEFFPGTTVREQDPLVAFQGHLSYNVLPAMWGAFDVTFYAGGRSTLDGIGKDDRQKNVRLGGTLVLPVGQRHSVKIGYSTGAVVRIGANFSTVSAAWQTVLF